MSAATPISTHAFEKAGLGTAPFLFLGVEKRVGPIKYPDGMEAGAPGQPMGCCEYCFQGIAYCYRVRSSDGREFVVGSECIRKVGDAGLRRKVDEHKRAVNREKRAAKAERDRIEIEAILADTDSRDRLAAAPHSRGFTDRQTGEPMTALDEAEWMFRNAGAAGRGRLLRSLRKRLTEPH